MIDYVHAANLELWDLRTASLYLLEVDPESVEGRQFYEARLATLTGIPAPNRNNLYKRYVKLHASVESAHEAGTLETVKSPLDRQIKVKPVNLLAWAKTKSIAIPKALDELVGPPIDQKHSWPWGSYETKGLRDIAAAVEAFWANFDLTKLEAAPTNAEVIKWLKGRGVALRTATTIAQLIRHEGIRPGPRLRRGF